MPAYGYVPSPPPLTQAELDALAAEQAAMGAVVPPGGYTAAAVPEPPATSSATEPPGGNDTITGYSPGYGAPSVGQQQGYGVSDPNAGAPYVPEPAAAARPQASRFVPGPPQNYVPGSSFVPSYIYLGSRGENIRRFPTQGAVPPADPETAPIHPGGVPGSGFYRWGGFRRPTLHRGWTTSGQDWPFWDLPPVPSPGLGTGGPAGSPRSFIPGSSFVPAEAPALTTTTTNTQPREITLTAPHASPRAAITRALGATELSPSLIGQSPDAPVSPLPRGEALAAMERARRERRLRFLPGLFGGGPRRSG